MTKRLYYQKEFNRIYDRFCFNFGLFGGYKKLRDTCYREALSEVENIKSKAIATKDIDIGIARMALRVNRMIEALYSKVG